VAEVAAMTAYTFTVTCPRCRRPLTHESSGTGGLETRAVMRCDHCRKHWMVKVELVDVSGEVSYVKPSRSGTAA
jgi:transposase-like protein